LGLLDGLALGAHVAFNLNNLIYCFLGVFFGTLIGVLPGIGPGGAMALLLPVSFGLDPVSGVIMLAGIYYGSQYGGSTTSILVNIPGESASVVTTLDGYQMAKAGRAGPALGMAAFGSFIAGTLGVILLMLLAVPLSTLAIKFGPPEYTAIMILGLTMLTYLAHGSTLKAIIMAIFGFQLSQIGVDPITGGYRFTLGILALEDGVPLIPLVMGFFGVSEVLMNLEESAPQDIFKVRVKELLPNVQDWKNCAGSILRGTFLGFFLGIIPGGGAVLASFVSYAVEKRVSKHPEKFGHGTIEGVAAPESANNAATAGAFIPLFTLGVPSNLAMVLLLVSLMIHGLTPGPVLLKQHPEIFWGTVMSMYVGNAMLLVLNLPLIGLWVKILKIPYRILFPFIFFFCLIGTFGFNERIFDIFMLLIFGIIGYILRKFNYELAPFVLAFILEPIVESSFRRSLIMSEGSFSIFFTRPIAAVSLIIAFLILVSSALPLFRKRKEMIAKLD
jgi:putative tricarboxylic transport membrane protein